MSAEITNVNSEPLTIEALEPGEVDSLVEARFIGHSDCAMGCVGGRVWTPEVAARAEKGTSLDFPLVLDVDERRFLTFELKLVSQAAVASLERECRAGIRSLRVTLQGKESELLQGPGTHIVAVHWSETCADE